MLATRGRTSERPGVPPNSREIASASCRHHWLIQTPAGATSMGTCRNCGATQEFSNIFEGRLSWDSEGSGATAPRERVQYRGELL